MTPLSADAIAVLHPQIVHFTIALAIVGVALRLVSLVGRPAFASPAATLLLVLAAIASVASTQSGTAAHGPVERMPGVRPAVVEHEEWGERASNVLIIVGTVELVGLLLTRWSKVRMVHAASGLLGLVAAFCVYEAADHGGKLVYAYAGGVGIRSGDAKDVERLLLAGLYQQALADRKAGRTDDAGELVALAGKRFAGQAEVQLLAAESLLIDKKDTQAAIQALAAIEIAPDNRILRTRRATLQADAFEAAGQRDAAIAVLKPIVEAFPTNTRLKQRLDSLMGQ